MFVQNRPPDSRERRLTQLFRQLSPAHQDTLLAFAEFLAGRADEGAQAPAAVAAPEPIPRPEEESVVKAIKRLTRTYPMLDHSHMLGRTSDLVSQHVLQGRAAREVIDELEAIFREHYERLLADRGDGE